MIRQLSKHEMIREAQDVLGKDEVPQFMEKKIKTA